MAAFVNVQKNRMEKKKKSMKRTKIVCTMGPKTENVELLKEMIKSGMNVARFNFSHGSHEEHAGRMALVEEARKAVNIPVATMLDTKGPEIRTGSVPGDKKVTLVEGQDFDLTIDQSVETTQKSASITYEGLVADAEIGCRILIDDGLIELKVISKEEVEAYAKLPSKETLLSQLVFMLQSPIQRVAIALNEIAKKNEEQSA